MGGNTSRRGLVRKHSVKKRPSLLGAVPNVIGKEKGPKGRNVAKNCPLGKKSYTENVQIRRPKVFYTGKKQTDWRGRHGNRGGGHAAPGRAHRGETKKKKGELGMWEAVDKSALDAHPLFPPTTHPTQTPPSRRRRENRKPICNWGGD